MRTNGLLIPALQLPDQRRLTGGKNLDGSFWIEIEGQGRVTMPPAHCLQMCVGFLRAMGIEVPVLPPKRQLLHG